MVHAGGICREPPGPPGGEGITSRDVGLDVEEWCPVHDIDTRDGQAGPFPFDEPHDRDANWVRTSGSAGGKYPVRPGVEEGYDFQPTFP